MYSIADNNMFEMMGKLSVTNEYKRELVETRFFLGLYKDIPIIVHRLSDFNEIPLKYRESAMEDIVQSTQISVYSNLDKFLKDPKSNNPGARVNYLKRIVYCRTRDWINRHYDEMYGQSMDDTEHEVHQSMDEYDAHNYIDVSHRLAKYLILFEKIDKKLLPKICFIYKDIEMKVNKSGKNGGLSGKNNVLERLNGRSIDDIRGEIPSEIMKVCPFELPENYMELLKNSLRKDLTKKPVFNMTYNYAVSACSRLKDELDSYEDDIITTTKTIIEMFEENYVCCVL